MREKDPVPTFSKLLEEVKQRQLAFVHLVEPRADAGNQPTDNLGWARAIWKPRPLVLACGFEPVSAAAAAQEAEENGEQIVIAFGRHFIANVSCSRRSGRRI